MADPQYHERPPRPGDPSPPAQSAYAASVAEAVAATAEHMAAARRAAAILVARARVLVSNGVDLHHPERACDFIADQVRDAVAGARLTSCSCAGSLGTAGYALVAELARQLAEATRYAP